MVVPFKSLLKYMVFSIFCWFSIDIHISIRSANTRMSVSLEQAQLMLEKGEKIEQEFAEYFTGETN